MNGWTVGKLGKPKEDNFDDRVSLKAMKKRQEILRNVYDFCWHFLSIDRGREMAGCTKKWKRRRDEDIEKHEEEEKEVKEKMGNLQQR